MLYEGVSARPTTISLAEIRESVSGQPMSAAGQTQKSECATEKSALPSTTGIVSQTCQVRKVPSFGLMHRTKTGQCSITASARVRVGSFGQPRLPKTLSHQLRV